MLGANRAVTASSDDRTLAAMIDTPYVLSMCFEKAVEAKPNAHDTGTLFYKDRNMEFVTCIECGYEVAASLAVRDDRHIFCSTDCLASCAGFTYVDGNGFKPDEKLLKKMLFAGM